MLTVSNLGKRYKVYARPRDRLVEWVSGGQLSRHRDIWALRNVSLRIERGERIGVIGRNGSGKSTLLKLVAGVLTPSEGQIAVSGRLFALLELSAGLNPHLTGRQNIHLVAELFSLPRGYAEKRLCAIQEFADIGEYFDRPLRTYSSGMHVRLAFSTFLFLDPDILIVDEALSVGDIFFRQKCYDAIRERLDRGTTLLYVSHDLASVANLCSRVLLLERGRPEFIGSPSEAISRYCAQGQPGLRERPEGTAADPPQPVGGLSETRAFITGDALDKGGQQGSKELELLTARVIDDGGNPGQVVSAGEHLTFQMLVRANRQIEHPNFGVELYDRMNQLVFATSSLFLGDRPPVMRPGDTVLANLRVKFGLRPGEYTFALVAAASPDGNPKHGKYLDRRYNLGPITVSADPDHYRFLGLAWLDATSKTSLVDPGTDAQG